MLVDGEVRRRPCTFLCVCADDHDIGQSFDLRNVTQSVPECASLDDPPVKGRAKSVVSYPRPVPFRHVDYPSPERSDLHRTSTPRPRRLRGAAASPRSDLHLRTACPPKLIRWQGKRRLARPTLDVDHIDWCFLPPLDCSTSKASFARPEQRFKSPSPQSSATKAHRSRD